MATYTPQSLGIKAPAGGFQTGGWYGGRQYWNGTLSDPGVIHEASNQAGAGKLVSPTVNLQSDVAQGNKPGDIEAYLAKQRQQQAITKPAPITTTAGMVGQAGATEGISTGAGVATGMGELTAPQATIDLPSMYQNLYKSAGITDLEQQYADQQKALTETKAKINDNPFLSEATRVGRVAKLEQLYNERTANLKNEIATKKADIETQMNLQTRQFDINSNAAKDALSKLNTLLGMGALSGASGEDIANITRSTGISSSMIQAAINASKAKDVKTQLINSTADDGTVTVSVVNADTGEIIKQTNLGRVGNAQTGGTSGTKEDQKMMIAQDLSSEARKGATWDQLYQLGQAYLDPAEIYRIYLGANFYKPTESQKQQDVARYGIKDFNFSAI